MFIAFLWFCIALINLFLICPKLYDRSGLLESSPGFLFWCSIIVAPIFFIVAFVTYGVIAIFYIGTEFYNLYLNNLTKE